MGLEIVDENVETAVLTADVVMLGGEGKYVLLIRRGWPPFQGRWALPGGKVNIGEETMDAAARELAEETGLKASKLRPVGVYSAPGRDPRDRYVSFAYLDCQDGLPEPTAGSDAAEASWVLVEEALSAPEGLAFDHDLMIRNAIRVNAS